MKTLTIIRHAKSSWSNPGLTDFDRTLNERGYENAKAMGDFLKQQDLHWDLVISSTAKRAMSTAEILLRRMGIPKTYLHQEPDFYHADIKDISRIIKTTDNAITHLAIFGHNPTWHYLVNHYLTNAIDDMPTLAVAILQFDMQNWQELEQSSAELAAFYSPKTI